MKRSLFVLIALLFMFVTGCSEEKGKDSLDVEKEADSFDLEKPKDSEVIAKKPDDVTLRIMTYTPEKWFDERYGGFKKLYPEIKIELISPKYELSMADNVKQQKPDFIFTYGKDYSELATAGNLAEVQGDRLDIENMDPFLISYLQALVGDGKLYGLTNFYSTYVLKYNKTLFDQYKIGYPNETMTWEDLFQLAKRFADPGNNERQIFGLSVAGEEPFFIIDHLRRGYNLSYFDERGNLNLHTEQWMHLFNLVLNGYKSSDISPFRRLEESNIQAGIDYFAENRSAMNLTFLNIKENTEKVGTLPLLVGPNSKRAPSYKIGDIGSVISDAEHPDEAWNFFRYVYSEELARIHQQQDSAMPARTYLLPGSQKAAVDRYFNYEVSAEQLIEDDHISLKIGLSGEGIMIISMKKALEQVLDNKKTLDEAIAELEKEVQKQWEGLKAQGK